MCEGKWKIAEATPQEALDLVLDEVQQGFVKEWKGSVQDAQQHWQHVAVGKLGIRRVPGKDSRLVLDSTAPGLNGGVQIQEKRSTPE